MKQTTFIIASIALVLILVAVWVYLLFFGNPRQPSDLFADLGIEGEEEEIPTTPEESTAEETSTVNLERPKLRQLTTKPVIGFVEVYSTTSDPIILRYAEAGTGHIYQINLASGEETRLTNTTIAAASNAKFSPDGSTVAISGRNDRRASDLTVGKIPDSPGNLTTSSIELPINDFTLFSSSTVAYTTPTENGLRAYARSLSTGQESTLFTIPFYEARVAWGSSTNASHTVYPKPTYALEGYLYNFTRGVMGRLSISGYGLTAQNLPSHIVYTTVSKYKPQTYIYNKSSNTETIAPLILLPEKCAPHVTEKNVLWCAVEETKLPLEYPDSWYQGVLGFKDSLWQINLDLQTADLLSDTFAESQREIDVVHMSAGKSGTGLYFINKNDRTLWMYEI